MKKVLFIGNFLSTQGGSIGPIEGVMNRLRGNIDIKKASVYSNLVLKFADMIFKSLFYKYDIIHIDTYSSKALYFAYFTSSIGNFRKKKVILNLHGGGLFEVYSSNRKKKKLINILFSKATNIISPSLYLQEKFGKVGFMVDYLPNSIDKNLFTYSENLVKNHKLLWVRAFNATYQPELAIKTLYEVRKTYPDTTLTMIGPDKGLLKKCKSLISELGLDEFINIEGIVPNDELTKYYSTHQVFLNTTDTESFGVAVMEAALCGIPIITTSVGELPYLWQNEKNAVLIKSFDEKDFSKAVCRLFENIQMSRTLKENAYLNAQSFDWGIVKIKWFELLK